MKDFEKIRDKKCSHNWQAMAEFEDRVSYTCPKCFSYKMEYKND